MLKNRTVFYPITPHGAAGENIPPERETRAPLPRSKDGRP